MDKLFEKSKHIKSYQKNLEEIKENLSILVKSMQNHFVYLNENDIQFLDSILKQVKIYLGDLKEN